MISTFEISKPVDGDSIPGLTSTSKRVISKFSLNEPHNNMTNRAKSTHDVLCYGVIYF